jgi:glyoxylase-like metal-dependent hydrolase (beta-lactamase superfamily II)
MKAWTRTLFLIASSWAASPTLAADTPDPAPLARVLAPGVWMIPAVPVADREPDGNTTVYAVREGLLVVDTGRHAWHQQAILALARAQHRPIVAVVNSHWHLDHVSGNPVLRAAHPRLKVYASNALDGALRGFLARSARDTPRYLDDPSVPEATRADLRLDLAAIEHGAALRPDVLVESSRDRTIGGHAFAIHLAPFAATSGDVWLYDPASGVASLGDLVTLPAPYLDTACPEGWKTALAAIAATPFRIAVPGHGPALTPASFATYRQSFERFIDCAASARSPEDCGAQWADDVGPLIGDGGAPRARQGAAYYVGLLRTGGGRSRDCEAR